jgi:hypothetical protein
MLSQQGAITWLVESDDGNYFGHKMNLKRFDENVSAAMWLLKTDDGKCFRDMMSLRTGDEKYFSIPPFGIREYGSFVLCFRRRQEREVRGYRIKVYWRRSYGEVSLFQRLLEDAGTVRPDIGNELCCVGESLQNFCLCAVLGCC